MTKTSWKCTASIVAMSCGGLVLPGGAAVGQTPAAAIAQPSVTDAAAVTDAADADIIVTARKREETLIAVPVAITAITGAQLEQRGINSIDGLARLVPSLVVGEGGGTLQGGNIVLRGVSGADSNPFADQAVSFNVDGVQVARSSVRRLAEMDLAQVEVLKGPQALYYGKNSPGGVISIRTADPTPNFSAKVSAGYEIVAREFRGEGYVSGPITDNLGFRIAAIGSTMEGWAKSQIPASAALQPKDHRSPQQDEYAIRGTLKLDASDKFDARLKFTYSRRTGDSTAANIQYVNCPFGTPQTGVPDDCTADDRLTSADATSRFVGLDPTFAGGKTFLTQDQALGGLEMNYHFNPELTLTSVTGYYSTNLESVGNFTASYAPATYISGENFLRLKEVSQELRLGSSFSGPFNFTVGAFAQSTRGRAGAHSFRNADAPAEIVQYAIKQTGQAYSVFGQATLEILPKLELSAGGRYSHERKRIPFAAIDLALNNTAPATQQTLAVTQRSFNNFSPEFTASYRPNEDLTFYGSYKKGFLSGGFNAGSINTLTNLSYDQQLIKGFEGGVKVALLDRHLTANLALYSYRVTGLQVTVTTGGGTIQELRNAGKVSTKGIDFDFSYRTPIEGLRFDGALSYNRGRYVDYQATCYRGQNANSSPPCLSQVNRATNTVALLQDLSGTELLRAPKFTGNFGTDYRTPVGGDLVLGLGADVTFSGSYLTDAFSKAAGRSPSYALIGASARIGNPKQGWEFAVIGRNLGEDYYWTRSIDNPFSGTPATGNTTPGRLGDTVAAISRGREVLVRGTFSF